MNTKVLLAGMLVLGVAIVPPVTADGDADCAPPAEDTVLTQDVGESTFYVTEDDVFEEDNGFDGLQSSSGSDDCGTPNDPSDDISWDADSSVFE